jgi:hypothetical protein
MILCIGKVGSVGDVGLLEPATSTIDISNTTLGRCIYGVQPLWITVRMIHGRLMSA